VLPPLETVRRHADACSQAHWLSVFSSRYREAKRAYQGFSRRSQRLDRRTLRAGYFALREYLEELTVFEADLRLRSAAGPGFSGLETPFDDLATVAEWYETTDDALAQFPLCQDD